MASTKWRLLSGGPIPSEPADLLVSLETSGPAAFARLASDLPHVRPRRGGDSCAPTIAAAPTGAAPNSLLGRHGFRIERRLRNGRRDVYVARREVSLAAAAR
ncbi:MAG: hypothetical protein WDM85_12500 [Caulobacteraceae bacterium]